MVTLKLIFSFSIMIFSILLIILASILISLIATPIQNSFLKPSQSMSYSHPLQKLEKRGGSVSSRSSSYSSLDSESASTPDAPVLKTPTMDDGRNQGQKRKGKISDEQRLRNNAAKRKVYARKTKGLEVTVVPNDTQKKQKTKYNEGRRNAYAQKKKELQGQPDALKEWRIKQQDSTRNSYARRVESIATLMLWPRRKRTRGTRGINARYYSKRLASFVADPAKKIAWRLKRNDAAVRRTQKKKMVDKEAKNVADIPNIIWGQKSFNLASENDNEEDENEEEGKFLEEDDENAIREVGMAEGDDTESIETIDWDGN
jgi:hypothetical protein